MSVVSRSLIVFDVSMSRRILIYFVLVAIFAFCLLQWHITNRLGEPYPAIAMPGFHGSGGYRDGQIHRVRTAAFFFFADGGSASFTQRQLLDEFPPSYDWFISCAILSPPREGEALRDEPAQRQGLRDLLLPGLHAGSINRMTWANRESLRVWLTDRSQALAPGRCADRFEMRWYLDTYTPAGGPLQRTTVPTGTLAIDLRADDHEAP
jgi:hypothetical protein